MTSSLPVTVCMHSDTVAFVFILNVGQIKSTYFKFSIQTVRLSVNKLWRKWCYRTYRSGELCWTMGRTVACTAENTLEVITVEA